MLRVLIIEDSATALELLVGVLASDPEIEIVGIGRNGLEAVEMTKRLRPDVIAMDVNMPAMNGFEATRRIMAETPVPIVIISATVDVRDVAVSMDALRAGALALLEKPPGVSSPRFEEASRQLVSTIKAMARVKVIRHWPAHSAWRRSETVAEAPPASRIRAVAIAASTGGPAALAHILAELPAGLPVPVLIVQHIATGFATGLAAWLNTICPMKVKVAEPGEPLAASTVYLAGDGFHMGVSAGSRIVVEDGPPIGGFRPSASYLFEAAGRVYGSSALAVMLTGMGQDGVEGLRALRAAGGRVLVQDESSSIVFGMPRAAIAAGLADRVLPLSAIGRCLVRMTTTATLG